MNCKISILTVALNAEKSIQKAIDSVLLQNYENFEHIIVDGGSIDETCDILRRNHHVRWISEKDFGQSDAMNKAFRLCTGNIVVYLNADDYFNPGVFKQVGSIFKNHDVDIVVGDVFIKTLHSTVLLKPAYLFKHVKYPMRYVFPPNPICYFYKKEVQLQVGDFPLNENYAMDYWFYLRACRNRRIIKLDMVFGVFDIHIGSKTFVNKADLDGMAMQFCKDQNIASLKFIVFTIVFYNIQELKKLYGLATSRFKEMLHEEN